MRKRHRWSTSDLRTIGRLREQGLTWEAVGQEVDSSGEAARKAWEGHRRQFGITGGSQGGSPAVLMEGYEWPTEVDWREWFDVWDRQLKGHKKIDPVNEKLTLSLKKETEPIGIVFAADLHMGGGWTDHAAIRETIEFILGHPRLYIGVTGDSIEGFIPGMKPAETIEQQPSSVKSQLAALQSLVNELGEANKLLWLSWGDHDAKWFEQAIGINVVKSSIHDRVPYFTGRGLITLNLGQETYYILVNHSERFTSQWNRTHPARRAYERFFPADVVCTAHRHKPAWHVDWHYESLREAGVGVGGKYAMVVSGTFKTGPDPYSIRSWSRGIIGVPTVLLYADRHDLDVFDGPERAATYLRGLTDS